MLFRSGAKISTKSGGGVIDGKTTKSPPSGLGKVLGAVGAGLSIASFMQAGFGMEDGASYAIGGGYAALMYFGPTGWFGPLAIAALVISIVSMVMVLGKVCKKKTVRYKCMPWQPPTGGLNCDLCNAEDTLCSKYKCESLGQTCEFINAGTSDELCIDNSPQDISSPRISPLYNQITEGYNYQEVGNNGFAIKNESNNCIEEYTQINYGIETDKPAQCKIGSSSLETYEEMKDYFGETNAYLINHSNIIFMPRDRKSVV